MSKSNRIRIVCVMAIFVFGPLSMLLDGYHKEAREDWIRFLDSFGIEKDLQQRYGFLTHDEMQSVESRLGERNFETRDALWKRYAHFDYWLSISRSLAALAVIILLVTFLRDILDRIPVPEKVYRRLYLPPDIEAPNKKEKDRTEAFPTDS